jgi:hypothetical protein
MLLHYKTMARNRGELDDIQRALIVFFKKNTGGE